MARRKAAEAAQPTEGTPTEPAARQPFEGTLAEDYAAAAEKNRGGRPPKLHADEATFRELRGLGRIQATVREGAAFFEVATSTFEEFLNKPGVREAWDQGKGMGRISLRRKQFELAEKNPSMAIFLGKNYLDQSDQIKHLGDAENPLIIATGAEMVRKVAEELRALRRGDAYTVVDDPAVRG